MQPARQIRHTRPGAARLAAELNAAAKLAVQHHNAGDLATAEKLYGHVLLVKPDHPTCLHNLGVIRMKRDDLPAALDLLEAAARADAKRALFQHTLGTAKLQTGDHNGAHAAFCRAVELQPGNCAAWDGLAMALHRLERFDEAIAAHRHALELDPASRSATRNFGNTLIHVGRLDEAEQLYERLMQDNPLDPDVTIQRGIVRLTRGDFRGWEGYAWSHWSQEWLKTDPPILVPLPQWDGQTLPDRGLMLYGEQGIGDEVMFSAFVTSAAARANGTTVLCEHRLVPLFARSFPGIAVAAKPSGGGEPPLLSPDSADQMRCSLSRLPGALGVTAGDFTGAPYLRADVAAVSCWRDRLAALGDGLKVGISWRGGNNDTARASRSVALQSFAPLFAIPGVRFVNLQYGNHAEEIAAFNRDRGQPLVSFEDVDPLRDMDGLAALLCALDLVISVDNSTVHLAGSLGVTTWMLCPLNANWRWTQQGESSHWYGSLRLFRQDVAGRAAWAPVIARMTDQLREVASQAKHEQAHVGKTLALPADHLPTPAAPLQSAPDILLINDSAYWHHWGCTATSLALHEGLRAAGCVVDSIPTALIGRLGPLPANAGELDDEAIFHQFSSRNAGLLKRMQAVPEVLINGDSIQDLGQPSRALLYLAWIARRRLGKRTSIVNHACHPSADLACNPDADAFYARIYQAMDYIAVRDACSAGQLARLGVEAVESFDCLPLFVETHMPDSTPRERRIVLAGSTSQDPALLALLESVALEALKQDYAVDILVGASAFFTQDDLHLVAALHPRLRGRYRLVAATSERQWLQAIAAAQLLVSGRFHHSVAAACLGTPLGLVGLTPKIEGLMERLGLDRNAISIPASDRGQAMSRISGLLRDPGPGLVSADRLAHLRKLAQRNFAGVLKSTRPCRN